MNNINTSQGRTMVNDTATRWFLNSDDFLSRYVDHAFPGADVADIRHELRCWDFRPSDPVPIPFSFFELFSRAKYQPCYASAITGALVWADVTGAAEYNWTTTKLRVQEIPSPVEEDHILRQERDIRDKLVTVYKEMTPQSTQGGKHKEKVEDREAEDRKMRRLIERKGAYIYPEVVEFILGCPTRTEKAAVLNLFSGAGHFKHPRPTLMLIAMFDDAQTARYGESSGYVIAYEFLSNLIIIKHWKSSIDHHPLQDLWFGTPPKDGVSYKGSPDDLLQRIIGREGPAKENPTYGFYLLSRYIAGNWLYEHFDPLGLAITPEMNHPEPALRHSLKATLSRFEIKLRSLNVPFGDRSGDRGAEDSDEEMINLKQTDSVQILYGKVLDYLEKWEVTLQDVATDDLQKGKRKQAENTAKFYDGITKAARTLIKDPEADFSFC